MPSTRSVPVALAMVVVADVGVACAPKEDVTPMIVVSPGARERMARMDQLRHHGAPRRLLPRVTVEEVEEVDLPAPSEEDAAEADAPDASSADAG